MQAEPARHTYELWFIQSSLGSDYGVYVCERCRCMFYHSPSTIYYNHEVKHECCCGYCTNQVIFTDWGERPYKLG